MRSPRRKRGGIDRGPLVLALLIGLVGCGPKIHTKSFYVKVVDDANDRSPVPVEFVLAKDEEATTALAALSARDWFDRRDQILLDNPDRIQSHLWEFVPGQDFPLTELPFSRKGAVALFIFAAYLNPGTHRARVDPMEVVDLRLGTYGFTVQASR